MVYHQKNFIWKMLENIGTFFENLQFGLLKKM